MNPLCPQCYGLGYVKNQYNSTALDVTCPSCNGVIVQHNPLTGHYRHVWVKYAVKINFGKRLYWFYTDDSSTIKPFIEKYCGDFWGYMKFEGRILQPTTVHLLPEVDHNVLTIIKTALNQNVPFWMYKIAIKSKRPIYVAQILTLKYQGYKRIDVLDDGTEIYRANYINETTKRKIYFYKYLTHSGVCGMLNNDGTVPYTAQH